MLDVADDAHNLIPLRRVFLERDTLPDRIFVREELAGQRLVDDRGRVGLSGNRVA